MKKKYEDITLITMDELREASDSIGHTVGCLMNLDPYIPLWNRRKFNKTYKYLTELYDNIEKIIINVVDASEREK